jgi:hypothetical protein
MISPSDFFPSSFPRFQIGVSWCLDEGKSMGCCGLVVLRHLSRHPKLELLIPPFLAPQLVSSVGIHAVNIFFLFIFFYKTAVVEKEKK